MCELQAQDMLSLSHLLWISRSMRSGVAGRTTPLVARRSSLTYSALTYSALKYTYILPLKIGLV